MGILVLQGPSSTSRRPGADAVATLWRVARAMGQVLSVHASGTATGFAAALRDLAGAPDTFVLIDPGGIAAATSSQLHEIRDALEAMRIPYAEIHDRSDTVLDLPLRPDALPLATVVIRDDLVAGYRIALGVALRCIARAAGPRD